MTGLSFRGAPRPAGRGSMESSWSWPRAALQHLESALPWVPLQDFLVQAAWEPHLCTFHLSQLHLLQGTQGGKAPRGLVDVGGLVARAVEGKVTYCLMSRSLEEVRKIWTVFTKSQA